MANSKLAGPSQGKEATKLLLENAFMELADHVTPNHLLLERWETKINQLVDELKSKLPKEYSIDRHMICGSLAKKTTVLQPDCDCILFINNLNESNRRTLRKKITEILPSLQTVRVSGNISSRKHILQFKIDQEIDVDLLLAHNKSVAPGNGATSSTNHLTAQQRKLNAQRANILGILAKKPEPERLKDMSYFSSLSENQVDFMRRQSPFVIKLVKILRFWYKNLSSDTTYNTPGLKYLVELTAVYWGQLEEKLAKQRKRNPSIFIALQQVFKMLSKEENIKVIFEKYESVPQDRIMDLVLGTAVFKEPYAIPKTILKRESFVVDPVNPFNDIFDHMMRNEAQAWKRRNPDDSGLDAIEAVAYEAQQSLAELEKIITKGETVDIPKWMLDFFIPHDQLGINSCCYFEFAITMTYFPDWEDYMEEMKSYTLDYKSVDTTSIKADFKASVPLASFGIFKDNYESPEEFKACLGKFQKALAQIMQGKRFISYSPEYIDVGRDEAPTVMRHHPDEPYVEDTFLDKVFRLELEYGLAFAGVLIQPLKSPGPCVVPGEDYGKQMYYACSMPLFVNVFHWKGEKRIFEYLPYQPTICPLM